MKKTKSPLSRRKLKGSPVGFAILKTRGARKALAGQRNSFSRRCADILADLQRLRRRSELGSITGGLTIALKRKDDFVP